MVRMEKKESPRYISVSPRYISVSMLYISVSLRCISASLRYVSVSLRCISASLRYISVSLRCISASLRSISVSPPYISVSLPYIPSPISCYFLVKHTLKIQNDIWHSSFLSAVPNGNPSIDPALQIAVSLKVRPINLYLWNLRSWCLGITQLATVEAMQCRLNHHHFLVLSFPVSQSVSPACTHYPRCNSVPPSSYPATVVTACLTVWRHIHIVHLN